MSSDTGCTECVPVEWGSPRFTDRSVGPFEVTDVWFPPGCVLDAHHHDRPIVAVTLEGAIESKLAGRSLLGRRDDLWTEPVGEMHSNTVGPNGARVLVVQPDPQAERIMESCDSLLNGVHHFRSGAVAHAARGILGTLREGSDLDDIMVEGLVLQLLAHATDRSRPLSRREDRVARAIEVIHDGFLDRLTVSGVAEIVGLSPGHLARAFKERTGCSVGEKIRLLRLDWAGRRLRASDDPIGAIAFQARFADQSHFTREFRRYSGRTPLVYRRSFRH